MSRSVRGDNTAQTTDGIYRRHPDRQSPSAVCDMFVFATTGNCLNCGNSQLKHDIKNPEHNND